MISTKTMDPMKASIGELNAWMQGAVRCNLKDDRITATLEPQDPNGREKNERFKSFVNPEDIRPESHLLSFSSDSSSPEDRSDTSLSSSSIESPSTVSSKSSTAVPYIFYSPSVFTSSRLAQSREPFFIPSPIDPGTVTGTTKHSDQKPCLKKSPQPSKLHPFSIEALLGPDVTENATPSSQPACVVSAFSQNPFSAGYCGQPNPADPSTRYWCHVCNNFLSGAIEALRHQMAHQATGASCSLRRSIFRQHGYVTSHVDAGYLNRIQCGLCMKVFSGCFFSKHMRIHDGHVCDVCDHEFATNSRLQDHANIHKGLTPFSCKICDRKFIKRLSLNQHVRSHRNYQSFKCSYCEKLFNSKYTCSVHERLHTGDNPFKCHVTGCCKAFPQKIQLQLHLNSHIKR